MTYIGPNNRPLGLGVYSLFDCFLLEYIFFYWIKKERERNLKSTEYRYFKLMKRIYQNLIGENRSAPIFHREKGLHRTASECTTAEKRRLLEKLKLKPQGFLCL